MKTILGIIFCFSSQVYAGECLISYPRPDNFTITLKLGDANVPVEQCLKAASELLSGPAAKDISQVTIGNEQLEQDGYELIVKRK